MDYEQIDYARRDEVAFITLRRPERLNAWTPRMSAELVHAIDRTNADDSLGAIVVTGAGRAFCAGADIGGFDAQIAGDPSQARPDERDWVALLRESKPLIAAVNGVVLGVGLTMILPFDRIVASTDARLSLRFVKMGLVPELASSHYLPQRVGFGAASDLMLSGRMVGADEAHAMGLVDELVAPEALLDAAHARARSYAENPAPQLRWIKKLLTENATETDLRRVQQREFETLELAYASPEHAEAVRAFLEKRPPRFR